MKKFMSMILAVIFILTAPLGAVTVSADVARVSKQLRGAGVVSGDYYLIPLNAPKMVMSITNASTSSGARVCIGKYAYAPQRVFTITNVGNSLYTIKNKNSGMVIEAKNNTKATGGAVVQASYTSLNRQRWYMTNRDGAYIIQSAISSKVLGVKSGSTSNGARINLQVYSNVAKQRWRLVKYEPTGVYAERQVYKTTVNGKKTLKTYLQNAMVPVGRTLYIWGGGWGSSDASVIGYQSSWYSFFTKYATSSYDYTKYRYQYGKGLDCSGYAAWVLYNTLYTKSGGTWLVNQSTTVAGVYADKGWATLAENAKDQTFKPGDVVSMSGHVWISLGQYSDGSVLLVHSSPKGVQISGTAGTAATKAAYYMKKYFPEWPYEARTVSSGYLKYVGKARWKVSGTGAILKDPDGIQKMSADKVMKTLFGT